METTVRFQSVLSVRPRCRGSVLVAMVVVLIALQVVVIGIVLSGSLAQDLTTLRLDASQTDAAATAGAQMALREIYSNTDDDSDGTIGSISNDANSANDPVVSGSKVVVSKAVAGSTITLTSTATGKRGSSAVEVKLSTVAGSGGSTRVFLNNGTAASLYKTVQSGGTWPTPTSSGSVASQPLWISAAAMNNGRSLVATIDNGARLYVGIADSSGNASYTQACSNVYGTGTKSFDVAVDSATDKGLVVYWNDPAANFRYRTCSGSTVSAESNVGVSLPGGHNGELVRLIPKPGGGTILAMMGTDQYDLYACLWDGSSFGSVTQLTGSLANTTDGGFHGAFEAVSGRLLAVYSNSASRVYYRIYAAGSLSAQTQISGLSGSFDWIQLAARPGTNEVYLAGLDSGQNIWGARWDGSAWNTPVVLATGTGFSDRRMVDVACSADGSQVVMVYADASSTLFYRTWTGSAWSAQQNGPLLGATIYIVELQPGSSGKTVHCIASTSASRLWYTAWNGSSFGSATTVSSGLSADHAHERFSLIPGTSPVITSWTAVQP